MQKKDKIRPSQPFWVMDTYDFKQHIYLQQGISHFYSFRIQEEVNLVVVPDGCIDLMYEYEKDEMKAYACGTATKRYVQHWNKDREIFGVRFMPGVIPAGINATPKDLINKRLLLDDIVPNRNLLEKLSKETDFERRTAIFLEEYTGLESKRPKPYGKMELVMEVKNRIYQSDGLIKISELAEQTGYSERYINKVYIELMGISPKTFCKIFQFQRALDYLNHGIPETMTQAAADLGYYDQPKFIKDFKEYAGITPKKYLKLINGSDYREKTEGGTASSDLF